MSEADPLTIHEAVVARIVDRPGVVVVVGGADSGKTSLARQLLRAALAAGVRAAWVDADLGQSTIGPPTTVGLRRVSSVEDIAGSPQADALYFVGAITPARHMLPLVAGTSLLTAEARRQADLVVVDTTGFIAGVAGQRLKFHKLELVRPDHVIGLQRGEELEPLLAVARRFTPAEVSSVPLHPAVRPTSVEQRAALRAERLAQYFAGEPRRFRVPPSVFWPSLPPGLDLSLLDGLLVGMDDGSGRCLGVGRLEHEAGALRLLAHTEEAPRGLRLGATRVEDDWRPRAIDLRVVLGSA